MERLMDDGEMRRSWQAAANPESQIKVLAQLNCISCDKVREIVGAAPRPKKARGKYTTWTEQMNAELNKGLLNGEDWSIIAERLGKSEPSVKSAAKTKFPEMYAAYVEAGSKVRAHGSRETYIPWTAEDSLRLGEYLLEGLKAAEIAERMGRTPQSIYHRIRRDFPHSGKKAAEKVIDDKESLSDYSKASVTPKEAKTAVCAEGSGENTYTMNDASSSQRQAARPIAPTRIDLSLPPYDLIIERGDELTISTYDRSGNLSFTAILPMEE